MKRIVRYLLFSLLLPLLTASVGFSSTILYVTSDVAELKSGGNSASATIMELERGTVLSLIGEEGRWVEVATQDSKIGWVYRGKVSEEEPEIEAFGEEGEGLGDLLGGLSGSDIRADAADSSRSIRGLSPETEQYAKATGKPQQSRDALDALLSKKISDGEIKNFLQKGKVGEYAE
jgi:uncharacterized protein YgiM (DUF1202 family)